MPEDLVPIPQQVTVSSGGIAFVPAIVSDAGEKATKRFLEFFTAHIRNKNTRRAYAKAVGRFCEWCEIRGISLIQVEPMVVAAYVEQLAAEIAKPSVKQHLAAIRMLFDWMVVGQIVPVNPASSVRGPKYVVKTGKTPVLTAPEARQLLDSIDTSTIAGLRDRALIGVMVYSFARIGAVVAMNVEDFYQQGRKTWGRLHEKGGRHHEVPAHHNADEYLHAYIQAAKIGDHSKGPLFRTLDRKRRLTDRRLDQREVLAMTKRRAKAAGLGTRICNHTFRATGITAYLQNGGTVENAQAIAGHESPRTTKLYDRTSDEIALDEVERILI